jgi:hypothetical protein
MNAILEQFIRAYTTYLQDDWVDWCPMAEFTCNNTTSETTHVSPFLANSGQHPRMGFEPPSDLPRPTYQAMQAREANNFIEHMSDIENYLKAEMKWAQAVYEENANRKRTPAPAYQPGDYVWLDTRNIKTRRPCKKFDWKNLRFRVIRAVSPYAYKLELPDTMRIHDVFHTSLLRPAADPTTALPGQINEPQPPVEVDGQNEYLIERILDSRYRYKKYEFLVKWTGYNDPTWEPYEFVKDVAALDEYLARYPDRPHPEESVEESLLLSVCPITRTLNNLFYLF